MSWSIPMAGSGIATIDYDAYMELKAHWNAVYTTRREDEVSWFEPLPALSVQMMEAAGLGPDTCVVDIGGGDSRLVDQLSARGLDCLQCSMFLARRWNGHSPVSGIRRLR